MSLKKMYFSQYLRTQCSWVSLYKEEIVFSVPSNKSRERKRIFSIDPFPILNPTGFHITNSRFPEIYLVLGFCQSLFFLKEMKQHFTDNQMRKGFLQGFSEANFSPLFHYGI